MRRKGKGRGSVSLTPLFIGAPLLTLALSIAAAKLMDTQTLPQEQMRATVCLITGVVALLLSAYTALASPQRKLLNGLATAAGYAGALLLANQLFFAEGYGAVMPVLLSILVGGSLGGTLGAIKHRKIT